MFLPFPQLCVPLLIFPYCHSPSFSELLRHWRALSVSAACQLSPLSISHTDCSATLPCLSRASLSTSSSFFDTKVILFIYFFILSLVYLKLCASCSVPDICTSFLHILANLCCQFSSSPTNFILEQLIPAVIF